MNFYGLKLNHEVICVSYFYQPIASHIVTAIQEKAQPCQFFTLQNPDLTQPWLNTLKWDDFTPTLCTTEGTSAF